MGKRDSDKRFIPGKSSKKETLKRLKWDEDNRKGGKSKDKDDKKK